MPDARPGDAERLASLGVIDDGGVRSLDLSRVGWMDPLHLVAAAAAAHRAALEGVEFRLVGPAGESVGYAARMRLGRTIGALGGGHDLPTVAEFDRSDSLLEVTELSRPHDVRVLAGLVHDRVWPTDPEIAAALYTALAEVGENVCDHSASVGFMAAQVVVHEGVLRFAVADAGIGLQASLAGRGAVDDATAIGLALSGTSRIDRPGRGTGLPATLAAVGRIDGRLLLASGSAAVSTAQDGSVAFALDVPFSGTLFEGAVPMRPRTTASGVTMGGQTAEPTPLTTGGGVQWRI